MTDRLALVGALCAGLFLAFIAGAYVMLAEVFPAGFLNDAYRAGTALVAKKRIIDNRYTQTDLWRQARTDARGVTRHRRAAAAAGYTLYTAGDSTQARLIDMTGRQVHQWSLRYSDLWQTTPDGRAAQTDDLMYWRKAHLFANGDLLVIFEAAGDSPYGYGLVKLDRDSQVLWSRHIAAHHDLDVADDGRVLVLTHEFQQPPPKRFAAMKTPWIVDHLLVLDAGGKTLTKHALAERFLASRFRPLFDNMPWFARADPLHTNSVQWITKPAAQAWLLAETGQALLSFRHPGVVALVDTADGEMRWATRGPWLGQHSARAQPDGRVVLFDNHSNFTVGNQSRIIEFDPATMAITWRYTGTAEQPFDSQLRGTVQALANGNRLITESDGGRIFEVGANSDIVWEYINPVRAGEDDAFIPIISAARRILPAELTRDFRRFLETKTR